MAKKKVSQSALSKQDEFAKAHEEVKPAMDSGATEKLENLKSLNQMLLKETSERRQQVVSLVHSKGCLEKELTRTNSDMEGLESELTRLAESAARLELERAVVDVFVGVDMALKGEAIEREISELKRVVGERESEIGRLIVNLSEVERVLGDEMEVSKRVCLERDEIKCKLDLQMEDDRELRSNLVQSEERKSAIERALVELRSDYDGVVGEKGELEMRIERISGERDSIERCLVESNKLIEEMKENARVALKEKELVEEEKTAEIVRRRELENDVSGLHEMVAELRKEEVKLLSVVAELEMKCFLGDERQKEMGDEMEVSKRVCLERDEIKCKLDLQMEDDRELRSNLVQSEERKSAIERALVELRSDYDGVVGEKGELEMRIERISGERDSIERCLVESNKLIEEMKENASVALKEKELVEEEKTAEIVRRRELENDVSVLHEMVAELRKEEVKLLSVVAELEMKCFLGDERQKEMGEETKLSEEKIKHLAVDKTTIERDLRGALKQFEEEKRKIEAMVNENVVMVESKGRLEGEVSALKKHVVELEGVVSKLEESSQVEVGKILNLESEVGDYRCNFELLKIERGEMEILLDEEKKKSVSLKEKIGALEDKIGERIKVYEKVKAEKALIFSEKVQLENRCGMLKKEITRLEDTITEARKEFDGMKGRAEMTALVLKETATAFCSSDDVRAADGEEIKKGGVVELEMIKNAFKNRESTIDYLKKQIELLQQAHKKNKFWTLLSSATTLLAVAVLSLPYVARGH